MEKQLSDYGITRNDDRTVTTDGQMQLIPFALLWFPIKGNTTWAGENILHLPGSEDGTPETFAEDDFIGYCHEMADDGSSDGYIVNGRNYDDFSSCRD